MAEDEDLLNISLPGYVSVKKAGEMLGVQEDRIYQLIAQKRLSSKQVGHLLFIPIEDVKKHRHRPSGRAHKGPPPWNVFHSAIDLLGTDIQVQVRPGQEEAFKAKLMILLQEKRHLLTGSTHRFILIDEHSSPLMAHIWLSWKDSELPAEAVHKREMDAFKTEFDDVLDWSTAEIHDLKGLLYT